MVIQLRNNDITNLLDLQGVLVNNHAFSKDLFELWITCPIKTHTCPCCGNSTSRVHDYYERSFNHIIINKKTLEFILNIVDQFFTKGYLT